MKKLIMLMVFLFAVLTLSVSAVPVTINEVEVNDVVLTPSGVNRLDVERGEDLDVVVQFTATQDAQDLELEAFISGYEYNDFETISDSVHVFDVDQNTVYRKTLHLSLPQNVEQDDYKLRILLSDRDGQADLYNYNVQVSTARHNVALKDVVISPSSEVEAGRVVYATVRVKNYGQQDEEGVKVSVAIPALGVSQTKYIDELDAGESYSTDELDLRIPTCAAEGTYLVKTTVTYDDGYESVSQDSQLRVRKSGSCGLAADNSKGPNTVISVGSSVNDVAQNEGGAIYPITVTNNGNSAKTYVFSVEGADFGSVRMSPGNVLSVSAGQSETVYLYVTANANAQAGERVFVVSVTSDGATKQIPLKANVTESSAASWGSLSQGLQYLVVALAILLLIFGLILVLSRMKGGDDSGKGRSDEAAVYY